MNKIFIFLCLLLLSYIAGCDSNDKQELSSEDAIRLQVWAHAGQQQERAVLQNQVERFNSQSDDIVVKLTFIPELDYNAQVQAAALAGKLPDLLEFDGPYVYNYIWQQHLLPLDDLLSDSLKAELLPSITRQGQYGQHLYSVGTFDSGLGLFARKSALTDIQARLPASASDAWSLQEFNDILKKLSEKDQDRAVIDLKLNYSGEWFTYGFSPVLQSAGADLINRQDYQFSKGIINGSKSVNALQSLHNWIREGYVDPNLDDAAFTTGRVALSWVGHWAYAGYQAAWPDDLILLPLPDFGQGSKTAQGSWNWGISKHSKHPVAAAQFIHFLLQTEEVLLMTDANGAVPATRNAIKVSGLYGENGPLRLFSQQLLNGVSIERPKTPAYPVITTEFQKAFQQIRSGGDVQQALDVAAEKIDQDIRDNRGYPFTD